MFGNLTFSKAAMLLAVCSLWSYVNAKSVYCHYMIATVNPDNAQKDIDQAKALGFDAFALNIGQPSAPWAVGTVKALFDYADSTGFKLFFSLDFYQTADLNAYTDLLKGYIGRPAYLTAGPNNHPVISMFSVGSHSADDFQSWKQNTFNGNIYFLPNADNSPGYSNPQTWFQTWGKVVDGVFGWETAWPTQGTTPANVSIDFDTAVQNEARANSKTYMAPMSSLQFKACCGGHYYRVDEINLPQRMELLLKMQPDFVEVLTWNDAGESHYIGNNWKEGLTDDVWAYSNPTDWAHHAWQPLINSFTSAFKGNGSMVPPGGSRAVGAMWYRPVLKSASCQKPDNWQSALDAVNYAVIVAKNVTSPRIRVTTGNGKVLSDTPAKVGLNYAAVLGVQSGPQKVELLSGNVTMMTATSIADITADSSDCVFNYKVVGLA
ncbi:Mutanase [Tolypocladium ophioglossoides CBS 100239]|uniref:Mutanase n=1 Tax=Tolypocladium ophioglossoides (strain CBS 100239) TaxID=1163406 RepID=A0A0L0MXU6_TOLOC|nr:Mutanase [Tolypocladium ophioglossoides CBS 100239]